MTERIKIDELFNLRGQTQQGGVHDIRKKSSQGLHVIAGLDGWRGRHPFIFGGLDEIVNFGVDNFEDAFLSCFLITSELLSRLQGYGGASGILGPGSC